MSHAITKLHIICGKVASGKSTLAAQLGQSDQTVVISEDVWLAALFGDEMSSIQDYVRCSAKLRDILAPHIAELLGAGVSVVLDFPANTIRTRAWMRKVADTAKVGAQLHYLDVPDAECKARLRERNARGDHPFLVNDEQFDLLAKHFVAPSEDEGFHIHRLYAPI